MMVTSESEPNVGFELSFQVVLLVNISSLAGQFHAIKRQVPRRFCEGELITYTCAYVNPSVIGLCPVS